MSSQLSPLDSPHVSVSDPAAGHLPKSIAPPQNAADDDVLSSAAASVERSRANIGLGTITDAPVEGDVSPADLSSSAFVADNAAALLVSSPVSSSPSTVERDVRRGSAWQASVPAILLFALGLAAQRAPLSQPLQIAEVERVSSVVAAGVVAPGETLVVSAKNVSGSSLLRGRLEFAGGVSGRAPLSGEIARVMVREGQFVQVNDRVLQISTSSGSRRVSRVENMQSSAESEQVEAVNAQTALQNKLAVAQNRLVAARERVARAGMRVAQARQIVQKLQRGENVEIPDAGEEKTEKPRAVSRRARRAAARSVASKLVADKNESGKSRAKRDAGASHASEAGREAVNDALRESQNARRAADAAQADVETARRVAEEADKVAGAKTQQVSEARAAVESAQKRLSEGTAKEADVEAAKAAVAVAETAAAEARTRMADARKAVAAKESAASSLRAAADKAASQAARAGRKLQLLEAAPKSDSPQSDSASKEDTADAQASPRSDEGHQRVAQSDGEPNASPVARAARLVEAALEESSDAIREARHLKSDVDEYDRQVKSTSRRLNSTGKELQDAQQVVLDNTIRTRLSAVRAPSSGTVLSVAPLASEVSEGETIITIGRPGVLRVRFADYSGAWKNLRPGALLTALVQPSLDQSKAPAVLFKPNASRADAKRTAAKGAASRATTPRLPLSGAASKTNVAGKAVAQVARKAALDKTKPEKSSDGVPIVARLRSVEAPRRAGQPAIMEAVIFNPRRLVATANGPRMRRVFRPGMAILCSIDTPGNRRVINVPSAAVLRDEPNSNRGLIAVLMPAPAPSPVPSDDIGSTSSAEVETRPVPAPALAPDVATNSNEMQAEPATAQSATAQSEAPSSRVLQRADDGSWHRIELRAVVLGRDDGVQQEIVSGLREGERIALQPAVLRTWSANLGARAAVRLQPENERAPSL